MIKKEGKEKKIVDSILPKKINKLTINIYQ